MATITGLTAARMLAIEAASVVDGEVIGDDLILTKHDGSTINAGDVRGPVGPTGPMGGMIPGEVRLWSGDTLPDSGTYGVWVWANGASYSIATYPVAAANISDNWNTFGGASSPGAGNFRVPDLRGLVPAGMDTMPAGGAANRVVRSEADALGGKSGEETHTLTVPEMPSHRHQYDMFVEGYTYPDGNLQTPISGDTYSGDPAALTQFTGGGGAHENMQPTVFVPYIVCLSA